MSFSDLTFLFIFCRCFFAVYYILPFRFKNAALVLGQLCLLLHRRGRARHTAAVRRAASALRPRPRNGGERSPHAKSTADHRAGGGPLLPRVLQVRCIYSGKSGQTDGDGVLPCRACAAARHQLLPFPERGVPHRRLSRRGGGEKTSSTTPLSPSRSPSSRWGRSYAAANGAAH
mgnify:CR=1 FL=1